MTHNKNVGNSSPCAPATLSPAYPTPPIGTKSVIHYPVKVHEVDEPCETPSDDPPTGNFMMPPYLPWFMTPSCSLRFQTLQILLSFFVSTSLLATRTPNTLIRSINNMSLPEPTKQPPSSPTGELVVVLLDPTCILSKKHHTRSMLLPSTAMN